MSEPTGTVKAATPTHDIASQQHIPLLASLFALGSGAVWSFGAITARLADEADAFQYLIWRSIAIIAVVEAIAVIRRRPPVTPQAYRSGPLMLLACGCLLLASIAFVYAVKNTSPANAAFLASITPLVAVVLAHFTLGERLTVVTIVAVAVAFVGLLVTVAGDLGAGDMRGNVAAVMSSVGFAGYAVCVRSDVRRDWSPVMPGYALMMIVICSIITVSGGRTFVPPAEDIALAVLHGGVFIVVGTTLFNVASRQIPAVAMAVFAQTEMLFVPLWALIILDEQPSTQSLVGGAIIFSAVIGKALIDATRPAM